MQPAPQVRPSAAARVTLRDVRRVFDRSVVTLDGVSLDVRPGDFFAILGPSGSGKSTLLRLIAGLDRPQGGSIRVDSDADSSSRPRLAYVFQDAHLLPWRTVLQNVVLPLELMRQSSADRYAAAHAAIEQVGLTEALYRYPNQLSGGMKMRVSLARALVTHPHLLLLDEPFAALDEITRQRLDEQLRDLWRSRGMTVIFVTHSISEAVFLAQRVVVLSSRPARVIHEQQVDLPEHRTETLRTDVNFARQVQRLHSALRGEAN